MEPQLCSTKSGAEGTCRLPSTCIGATIQFLEDNECRLTDGGVGTCCVPVPVDNIINIIDSPKQSVPIPSTVALDKVEDLVPRFGTNTRSRDKIRFASEEPAPDVEVDTNFIDDSSPSDFHLR